MTTETDLQRRIQLELSSTETKLLRNNVGEAWLGRTFTVIDGCLASGQAIRVAYGLGPGSSDLIGLHAVVITSEMIGRRVALFSAIEVKRPIGRVNLTREQQNFIHVVENMGGLAGVARSIDDARRIVMRLDR